MHVRVASSCLAMLVVVGRRVAAAAAAENHAENVLLARWRSLGGVFLQLCKSGLRAGAAAAHVHLVCVQLARKCTGLSGVSTRCVWW